MGAQEAASVLSLAEVAGHERPDNREVVMAGEVVNAVPPFTRDVCTVFQSYALFPHLTVRENVECPLRASGEARLRLEKRAEGAGAMQLSHCYDHSSSRS